jgi:hypothetical protein
MRKWARVLLLLSWSFDACSPDENTSEKITFVGELATQGQPNPPLEASSELSLPKDPATVDPIVTGTADSDANRLPERLIGEWIQVNNGGKLKLTSNRLIWDRLQQSNWNLSGVSDTAWSFVEVLTDPCLSCSPTDASMRLVAISDHLLRGSINDSDTYFYLLRDGIDTASLIGRIVGLEIPQLNLTESSNTAHAYDVILNDHNESQRERTAPIKSSGEFLIPNIKSGSYDVHVKSKGRNESVLEVSDIRIARVNDDIGLMTISRADHNFKCEFIPKSQFSFDNHTYGAKLKIKNIGSSAIKGVNYQLKTSEPSLVFNGNTWRGILSTIEPGAAVEVDVSYSIQNMELLEEKNVAIAIVLRDAKGNNWDDTVYLDIYHSAVNINIGSLTSVSGVVVFKDRKLVPFDTKISSSVTIPYSTNYPYKILISASSIEQEAVYSIGLQTPSASTTAMDAFFDTGAFEPNDDEDHATHLEFRESVISYLYAGDLDFFTFGFDNPNPDSSRIESRNLLGFHPVVSATIIGDGKGPLVVSPGDGFTMKLKVKNFGLDAGLRLTGTISSSYDGLTLAYPEGTKFLSFGDILPSGESCGTSHPQDSPEDFCSSPTSLVSVKLSTATPLGEATINFTVIDEAGLKYVTDGIKLVVAKLDAKLVFSSTLIPDDYRSSTTVNPGDKIYVKLKAKNLGTATAPWVTGTVSTSYPGMTLTYPTGEEQLFFGYANPDLEICGSSRLYRGRCERKVVGVEPSRRKAALDSFFKKIGEERCALIEAVATDEHDDYLKSVEEHCPNAIHILDRFHLMRHFEEAINDTRKLLVKMLPQAAVKKLAHGKFRYIFLKRDEKRSALEKGHMDKVMKDNEGVDSGLILAEREGF